jgi:hypothetical protein
MEIISSGMASSYMVLLGRAFVISEISFH